jgi:arsenite methyltransferase
MTHQHDHGHEHPHEHHRAAHRFLHSHTWFVGVAGIIVGLVLLLFVPRLEAVSRSLLLFAGFHILGGVVLFASLYAVALHRIVRRILPASRPRAGEAKLDFGWGPEWMNGLALAAAVALFVAIAFEIAAPSWWPVALLLAVAGSFFLVGNFIMLSFRSRAHIVLPMVNLLQGNADTVLDAGCGAGRTTIALGRVLGAGRVVAVDRFDAVYIDDGGRALLAGNLRVAGLSDRVTVETADLTDLPFAEATFDSAVSTNVFDHLGEGKGEGLREAFRVLKPGGRFLMAVWVPGWEMFAVGNVFSFFMTSKKAWRRMARAAGFEIVEEGAFNYA